MFDDAEIGIPCPQCGTEHLKSIGWLRDHHEIACGCGANIKLDVSGLMGGVDEANQIISDLTDKIGKIGK